MSDLKEIVRSRLAELGINPFEAARRGGLERGFINDILQDKKRSVKGNNILRLATALDIPADALFGTAPPDSPALPRAFRPARPGPKQAGAKDLPVYATAEGGDGLVTIAHTDAIDYVTRPDPLDHVSDGYGVYISGDSMAPAFEPGDYALVHPKLPPLKDVDVVLYRVFNPAGDSRALIKRLIGQTPQVWRVKQWNEPKEFELKKSEWSVCHRVVGKYSRR